MLMIELQSRGAGENVALEGFTYQLSSPIGLDLELTKLTPKIP